MNAGKQPWQCHNPFTREPMFFISDPPHLLKKLRNQLFNRGDEERHTRLMVHNDGPLLWNHIEAVREADPATRAFENNTFNQGTHELGQPKQNEEPPCTTSLHKLSRLTCKSTIMRPHRSVPSAVHHTDGGVAE